MMLSLSLRFRSWYTKNANAVQTPVVPSATPAIHKSVCVTTRSLINTRAATDAATNASTKHTYMKICSHVQCSSSHLDIFHPPSASLFHDSTRIPTMSLTRRRSTSEPKTSPENTMADQPGQPRPSHSFLSIRFSTAIRLALTLALLHLVKDFVKPSVH